MPEIPPDELASLVANEITRLYLSLQPRQNRLGGKSWNPDCDVCMRKRAGMLKTMERQRQKKKDDLARRKEKHFRKEGP